ncbi:hypothetical protein AB3S75_006347 [Citrus x aurantiifolia]
MRSMELGQGSSKNGAMQVEQVLFMNGGEGDNSYANNSAPSREATLKTKPLLHESLFDLYCKGFPDCIRFTDMGCSSGPNAFLPTLQVVEALDTICSRLKHKPPILHAFLNDLPGNDFNTVSKSLPSFYERLKTERVHDDFGSCFIAAAPGSFHGRLFPPCFLNLVYSSFCLHWLSRVPKELVSECGIPLLNKRDVCVAKTCSPSSVHKAYLDQFEIDFTSFLKFRSEELKTEGRMILNFISNDKYHTGVFELMGMVLNDMVYEGLIEVSKLESFNFPMYNPCVEEVRQVIEREGSFNIHQLETSHISWSVGYENNNKGLELNEHARAKNVADNIRAVSESLLANHFGSAIMDDLFHRFTIKISAHLEMGLGAYTVLFIYLIKK